MAPSAAATAVAKTLKLTAAPQPSRRQEMRATAAAVCVCVSVCVCMCVCVSLGDWAMRQQRGGVRPPHGLVAGLLGIGAGWWWAMVGGDGGSGASPPGTRATGWHGPGRWGEASGPRASHTQPAGLLPHRRRAVPSRNNRSLVYRMLAVRRLHPQPCFHEPAGELPGRPAGCVAL